MKHTCAALHCEKQIDTKYLMCLDHWRMIPQDVQTAVYRTYFRDQRLKTETTADERLEAVYRAVEIVAEKEGHVHA